MGGARRAGRLHAGVVAVGLTANRLDTVGVAPSRQTIEGMVESVGLSGLTPQASRGPEPSVRGSGAVSEPLTSMIESGLSEAHAAREGGEDVLR